MPHATLLRRLALTTFAVCLGVVVLGAYVRLSNAGLGCPDWPGCYGHLSPVGAAAAAHAGALPATPRPLDLGKAWREMLHRYAAGTLAALILLLAGCGYAWRRERVVPGSLLIALPTIVLLQAALGMLTVTRQLQPLIVSLHLLVGLTTLGLLWWLLLQLSLPRVAVARGSGLRHLALAALIALGLQIALGGWTSSNYAALACPDLPTCQGRWWPPADFAAGYRLLAASDIDYEGGVLDSRARVAIHLGHRIGALAAALLLLTAALAALLAGERAARTAALALLGLLALQLSIGLSMVRLGFPLWLATAHNAGAALLLLATLALNRVSRPASSRQLERPTA